MRYRLARVELSSLGRIFARFGGNLRPHVVQLVMGGLCLLGVAFTTLLQPWPLKVVFDFALLPAKAVSKDGLLSALSSWEPMSIVLAAALAVLALTVVKGLLAYGHEVMSKIVGHRLIADIRFQLFSHVQRLPQSYHDYRETGDLMTRMTGDLSLLNDLLITGVLDLTTQILLLLGMSVVMLWIDPMLALATIAVIPFFVFAAFSFSGRIKSSARRQREAYGKVVAAMQDSLAGIAHVKGYGQEKVREKLLRKSSDRDVKANVKTTRLTANYVRTVELIGAAGTGLVLWLGAKKTLAGSISPGDLLIFLAYLKGMYRPLRSVANMTAHMAKATVRGEKILELLDLEPEVHDVEGAVSSQEIQGDIRFDQVHFSYVEGREVLYGLSCHIPEGKTTLIVGPTGAGKSTIAKLVLRLYNPGAGAIYLDGNDITRYRIGGLRKRITPLSQDTFLFRTTIGENIAFGNHRATREDIEAAATLAGADDFIRRLPDGYDTLVGEGGLTLSGGQRQRVSFARAALHPSSVMIFDEPASGLDVHAEQTAKEVLGRLRAGRTLMIITHRLHFLDLADWVIFIRDGRLVDEGTPEALLAEGSAFRAFVASGESGLSRVARGPEVRS
jgi:ABC-type multidrug transport system fused ATPase/permease subunit